MRINIDTYHFRRIKSQQLGPTISLLIRHNPLCGSRIPEITIEMGVSEGPEFDLQARPAQLMREIGDESGLNSSKVIHMLRVNRGREHGRAVVREDDNRSVWVVLNDIRDLAIQPLQISLMGRTVGVYGPVFDAGEIGDEALC